MGLRKIFKNKLSEMKQERAERQIFLKGVRKKTLKAQRETYEHEAIRQAKKRGKRVAKEKYKKGITFSERVRKQSKKLVQPTKGQRQITIKDII